MVTPTPTDQVHPDEWALLAAIIASPDDDAARLAYAGWLEEQGQLDRARYIRWRTLGLSALGLRGSATDLLADMAQLEADAMAAFVGWAGPELAPYFGDRDRYDRGLLNSVEVGGYQADIPLAHLLSCSERLFRLAPVTDLRVHGGTSEQISSLLIQLESVHLRNLRLSGKFWSLDEIGSLRLRPELAKATTLELSAKDWRDDTDRFIDALVASPDLLGLRNLRIDHTWRIDGSWTSSGDSESGDYLSNAQLSRLRKHFGSILS